MCKHDTTGRRRSRIPGCPGGDPECLVCKHDPTGRTRFGETMLLKNRMREIGLDGSVGESVGNHRLYPECYNPAGDLVSCFDP